MPALLPSVDVASAAKAYADYGGLLVGFAFVGLFFYLTDVNRHGGPEETRAEKPSHPVKRSHVTLTVLFAMASLSMTSFLYANLTGEAVSEAPSPPAWAVAALLPYGVAFGLSVLLLFYALTLIMLERSLAGVAGWSYWMVACVGPAVVLRFLLGAAAGAQEARCLFKCAPGWPLSRWWMFLMVAFGALVTTVIILGGLDWKPARGFRNWLRDRPAAPAIAVFVSTAVMTGLGSLYFTGRRPSYRPAAWLVTTAMWVAVAAVVLFALACGCVIGPRVNVALTPRLHQWWMDNGQRRREQRAAGTDPDAINDSPPTANEQLTPLQMIGCAVLLIVVVTFIVIMIATAR